MRAVPLSTVDDQTFRAALALQQRDERAADPASPVTSEPELRRYAADDRTDGNRHHRLAVLDDAGTARALVHVELEDDVNNRHLASVEAFGAAGDPDAGLIGVAAALDLAEADGRTSMLGWGADTAAEAAFWTGLGAEKKYSERMSALDVTAVDGDLMQRWVDQRTERAADVRLVRWEGRCPDEHLGAWIESRNAMNDAPHEDLDVNDGEIDAARLRADEEARLALGTRVMNLFALDPQGGPVGHTTIHVNTFEPAASWQWDTVVLAAHRRRGIGRWLKAAMWQWLRADAPEVTRLRTGNAESNAAMLSINVAMGFRAAAVFGAWQTDVPTFRRHLAGGRTSK
ncbi:MAG: hypothetical protein R2695_00900 [Acidimicrobiales bacterium]